jgi:hypothetical protein
VYELMTQVLLRQSSSVRAVRLQAKGVRGLSLASVTPIQSSGDK